MLKQMNMETFIKMIDGFLFILPIPTLWLLMFFRWSLECDFLDSVEKFHSQQFPNCNLGLWIFYTWEIIILNLVFVTLLKKKKVLVYHATEQKGSLIMLKDFFFQRK